MKEDEALKLRDRQYSEALDALGSLITAQKRSDGSKWQQHFDSMHIFLQRLGLTDALSTMKIIHVAGTKGKGSTCCMIESMLRKSGYKTGLFTSPHLCDVRERIRLNGCPIEKGAFLRYFWECFEIFRTTSTEEAGMPAYFRFLTLLGFKTFIEEKVDVAIIEVGLGGRLDATNIIPNPSVCGISSLGYDHMELLGHTLTEIAREKAGILKKGHPAITIPQEPEAQRSLEAEAEKRGVTLDIAPEFNEYRDSEGGTPSVGLAGSHQRINAALAIALASNLESQQTDGAAQKRAASVHQRILPDSYRDGLRLASWPGRCQVISETYLVDNNISQLDFYLDGAHTPESLTACAHWFAESIQHDGSPMLNGSSDTNAPNIRGSMSKGACSNDRVKNFLVFNCMKERQPERLLHNLRDALRQRGTSIDSAIFVPPDSIYSKPAASKTLVDENVDLSWQMHLRSLWQSQSKMKSRPETQNGHLPRLPNISSLGEQHAGNGAVLPNLRTTLSWLRSCAQVSAPVTIRVLVTGSLYLVGDLLRHLDQDV